VGEVLAPAKGSFYIASKGSAADEQSKSCRLRLLVITPLLFHSRHKEENMASSPALPSLIGSMAARLNQTAHRGACEDHVKRSLSFCSRDQLLQPGPTGQNHAQISSAVCGRVANLGSQRSALAYSRAQGSLAT
jgi:hypothetical protein